MKAHTEFLSDLAWLLKSKSCLYRSNNKFIEKLTNKFGTLSESKNLSESVVTNSFKVMDGLIDIIGEMRLRGVTSTRTLDDQVQK